LSNHDGGGRFHASMIRSPEALTGTPQSATLSRELRTPASRTFIKATPSRSAERLRQRCIDQALQRRFQVVERHRADVGVLCADVAKDKPPAGEVDDEDEADFDLDFMLWLEQEVMDELRRREQALCEEREAYEEAELAALLETHLSVQGTPADARR
jgi:hypothetical protein